MGAGRLPYRLCHGQILRHALGPIGRAVAEEPLLGGVAHRFVVAGQFGRGLGVIRREAQHAGIGGHRRAGRTTEQAIDPLSPRLAFEIPERTIDHTDCGHKDARPSMPIHTDQLVVQLFGGQWIAA